LRARRCRQSGRAHRREHTVRPHSG
jgi:hypothetical protein